MEEQRIMQSQDQMIYVNMYDGEHKIHLYVFKGLIYADLYDAYGSDLMHAGIRVYQNQWIFPQYIAYKIGNCRFETVVADKNEYISYEEFNDKFKLRVYTPDEYLQLVT